MTLRRPGRVHHGEIPERPFHYVRSRLRCDRRDLAALADEFATPLYVYSAEHMRDRLVLFQESFLTRAHTVCFAVKANSSLAVLRLFAELGAGFDIVSGGELERVRRAHRPALRKVVFSGVGKQTWEIDAALAADILLFNVESDAELDLLAGRSAALGRVARFALRVNPDVLAETHPYISTGMREHKFGIDIALARDLYRRSRRHRSLEAAGVSVHIGSQIRTVAPFGEALARVVSLVRDLRGDGHPIRIIDAGGGLGVDYEAQSSGESGGSSSTHQVKQYADTLLGALDGGPSGSLDAHLIVEPGRFLVAQGGGLLTRVLHVKQNGDKQFVVTDAGMNDLLRPALYGAHHAILPVRQARPGVPSTIVDVVGPVCETGDFFARDRGLALPRAGDLLLVLDTGAYGMTLASNYNTRARAAEVLVDGAEAHLIRRRETMADLLRGELLAPSR